MATENNETRAKSDRLINLINTYPFSCDLIVTFFYTSVFSNRFDSRAIPFPPAFIKPDGEKDIDKLRAVLKLIPPLAIVRKVLRYSGEFDYVEVLDWLFTTIEPRSLELTETSHLNLPIDQQPNTVFGVRSLPIMERAWNKKKGQKGALHAFYGTNMENLYSIMKHGLNPMFSTVTQPLYGDGLYLTNQMGVSLLFSPFSEGWKYSMIGERLRVLVLCEIIEDYSKIKRLKKQRSIEEQLNCAYILVKDKNYVRVKYFFVYTKPDATQPFYSKRICLHVFMIVFAIFMFAWAYVNKTIVTNIFSSILK